MKVTLNGVILNYEDEGGGAPLVMLHGAGLNLHFWKFQADYFKAFYRVIRLDFRGHGKTVAGDQPLSAAANTADVIGLLDHLGLKEVVLMGHSMGGLVALYAAADFPQRVKAIIVANSAGIFPPANPRSARLREEAAALMGQGRVRESLEVMNNSSFSPGFRDKNPQVVDWLLEVRLRNRPEDVLRQWKISPQTGLPPAADLGRVHCPVLFVAGEYDLGLPLEYMEKAHQGLAGSRLVTLPTAHSTPVESPGLFNQAVQGFLREVRG
jgi:3-oxoadipate enol-lactonase